MAPISDTQRLASELSRRARSMQPGEDFGTVRGIAEAHGVSIDVARRALGLLVRHGLLHAEARQHVVADPTATIDATDDVAVLKAQIAEIQRRIDALESSADPELRGRVGRLEAEIDDLKAVVGSPRQSGSSRRRASG